MALTLRALFGSSCLAGLRPEHGVLLVLAGCAADPASNDDTVAAAGSEDSMASSSMPSSSGAPMGSSAGDPSMPGSMPSPPTTQTDPGPSNPPPPPMMTTGVGSMTGSPPTVSVTATTTMTVQPTAEPTGPVATGGAGPTPPVGGAGPVASGGSGGSEPTNGGAGAGVGGAPPTPEGICPASPGTPPSGTIAATLVEGVEPEDNNYHLFEGAAWLGDALYFSDINPNPWDSTIRKYVPATGMVTNFLVAAGSNGLAVSSDGVLHSATARKKQISRYDGGGAEEPVVSGSFNSPNDIAIASDGTIYFSDPQQGELPAGNQPQVVHVVKGGVDAVFTEAITSPNGVTLSPDESILYVSGGGFSGYVKKVTLADGLAGAIEDLATGLQVPDGMGIDCAGNLYVALHEPQQVAVYDPSGMQIATITIGNAANGQAGKPTNVAFGGADRRTLYVTAAYSLWEVPLDIAGFPN